MLLFRAAEKSTLLGQPTSGVHASGFSTRGFSGYGILYFYGCICLEYVWVSDVALHAFWSCC